MNTEEAKALLKDRGVAVMNMPHGYIVTVSRREGSTSRRNEMDEMDAILVLGKITLLAVEDTVGDIIMNVQKASNRSANEVVFYQVYPLHSQSLSLMI
jgi:hypothetical protein